jgi:glycosyltransferase involved in cell wall biosynthesis
LPKDLSVEIVHNGFPLPVHSAPASRRDLHNRNINSPLRVGCVGGLLKLKGVFEFVEAARLCIEQGLNVEFILVGENPRVLRGIKGYLLKRFGFGADTRAQLDLLIRQHGLQERVKIIGFTSDVKAVYDSIDILCFPSHLNACGRPVFEAAFSHVPSIVAVDNPLEDTIVDGQTGICIAAKDPAAIVKAVSHFYFHREELQRMGEAAFELAKKNFDISANAEKILNIYRQVLKKYYEHGIPS